MKTVYSIGHSNHPLEEFLRLLQANQIRYLIDIRSVPYSKFHPQYNQESLKVVLDKECIQYVFLGNQLGGRITNPACYKNHEIPKTTAGYATFLEYDVIKTQKFFLLGIQKLHALIDMGACAIMCSEENPDTCHRELIVGRKLKEDGFSLIHIRAKKDASPQLSLFEQANE